MSAASPVHPPPRRPARRSGNGFVVGAVALSLVAVAVLGAGVWFATQSGSDSAPPRSRDASRADADAGAEKPGLDGSGLTTSDDVTSPQDSAPPAPPPVPPPAQPPVSDPPAGTPPPAPPKSSGNTTNAAPSTGPDLSAYIFDTPPSGMHLIANDGDACDDGAFDTNAMLEPFGMTTNPGPMTPPDSANSNVTAMRGYGAVWMDGACETLGIMFAFQFASAQEADDAMAADGETCQDGMLALQRGEIIVVSAFVLMQGGPANPAGVDEQFDDLVTRLGATRVC